MHTLELTQQGCAPYAFPLSDSPVLIGRAPSNDLVVSDDQVSWHHAAVWLENGALHVRDMGSRNGTLLNGERIRGLGRIEEGDVVSLGPTTQIRLRTSPRATPAIALLLEQIDAGVRIPLRSDRFDIGSGAQCDLRIPDAPPRAATLLVEQDGEVVLATEDSAIALHHGQVFEIAGHHLRVVSVPPTHAPTVEPEEDRYPYALRVTLNGVTGPEATLEDTSVGLVYRVDAENRAILLYMLARKLTADLDDGMDASDAGWASDDEVSVGVWGKGGPSDANNLHVLVYRLRKELQKAGFDPWFIEKRRRALRVRLRGVRVD
ncbi:MAG: FHA domain-containing protein [Alphaproteobacteria bacterium]|nr:FHA domain-containing protein [Alphaproteobacteria bacterium]MCB9692562.1 FHA domain-containing protein [Alphaproteobacteria bacterium]